MRLPEFEYLAPKTVDEACSLLSQYRGQAKVIAGGTDLLVQMKHKEALPKYLVNLRSIPDQEYIIYDGKEGLRIGAQTTIQSVEASSLVRERFGILAQAASHLGTVQVRNRGTIGGNLCNAAPSAEMAPPLIALAARVKIRSTGGERMVHVEDFFTGPGQTILKPDEVVTEIQVPDLPRWSGGTYMRYSIRRALDLPIVGVGVVITMGGDVLSDVKIALGAVAPTPIRVRKAEEILKGNTPEDALLEKAGLTASEEASPRDSIRASAEYKRRIIKALVRRALKQAIEQARAQQ